MNCTHHNRHWNRPVGPQATARRRPVAPPPLSDRIKRRAVSSPSIDDDNDASQTFALLDATSAAAYARARLPHLFGRDGNEADASGDADAVALGGGVINSVFSLGGRAVLKQAPPYVRAVGPSFPLSRARMDAEAAAMALAGRAAAAAAVAAAASGAPFPSPTCARPPAVLLHDPRESVLVCERVPCPPYAEMYSALIAGDVPAGPVASPLFRLLAALQRPGRTTTTAATDDDDAADDDDDSATKAAADALRNEDMVRANLDVVLRSPFGLGERNKASPPPEDAAPPRLRADASRLLAEPGVNAASRALDARYAGAAARATERSGGLAFAHNDLHPGNVFVACVPAEEGLEGLLARAKGEGEGAGEEEATATQKEAPPSSPSPLYPSRPPYLIDWEFAAPGPGEFDVGTLCGNLLAAALVLPRLPLPPEAGADGSQGAGPHARRAACRSAQRAWLLAETAGAWRAHEEAAAAAAAAAGGQAAGGEDEEQEEERWAVAYAGMALVRQVIGLHRHPLLRAADDAVAAAAAAAAASAAAAAADDSAAAAASSAAAALEATERSLLALGRAMMLAALPGGEAEDGEGGAPATAGGGVRTFGGAAAVALELARSLDDMFFSSD